MELTPLTVLLLAACSSPPDLEAWRRSEEIARSPERRTELTEELERVDRLREIMELESSRALALALAAENPGHAEVLFLASRAESDAVFLFPGDGERERRDGAAWSALDYARRSLDGAEASVAAMAQYAWAMGTSTHLQPMFDRAEHAVETLEAIEATLARDPDETTALATKSILRLRLATLPWIARVMASGAPEGSIEEAVKLARRCVSMTPSLEHCLILARALLAAGETDAAVSTLRAGLAAADRFPRDQALRPELVRLLSSLPEE